MRDERPRPIGARFVRVLLARRRDTASGTLADEMSSRVLHKGVPWQVGSDGAGAWRANRDCDATAPATVLQQLRREVVMVTTDTERMLGTTGWCGTVDGHPAILASFYGGANLWVFNGSWKILHRFEGEADFDRWRQPRELVKVSNGLLPADTMGSYEWEG